MTVPQYTSPVDEAELAIKYVLDKGTSDEYAFNYGGQF